MDKKLSRKQVNKIQNLVKLMLTEGVVEALQAHSTEYSAAEILAAGSVMAGDNAAEQQKVINENF